LRVIRADTADAFAARGADLVAAQLERKPASVLALPTGNTPLGLYAELLARAHRGRLSFADARLVNLDEYCGVPRSDPHSYAAFLDQHLLGGLDLDPDQVRLLRGDAGDLDAECRDCDANLDAWGGIDLCILGLGRNGHIAFNEPGSPWTERTHIVELSPLTLSVHAEHAAAPWRIPSRGITLGIRNLLEARHILLLIAGARKEAAKQALYRGRADPEWPVTSLLGHPSVTVMELCGSAGSP
jgi:glucosamine-6-phosphate deaminase